MEFDHLEFTASNLAANMAWLRDLTRCSIDPAHETHANPCPL